MRLVFNIDHKPQIIIIMHLTNKIKAVNQVYKQLELHTLQFKKTSGIKCISDCSHCCSNKKINATALEFLPAAYDLFINNNADNIIESLENRPDPVCVFYNPMMKEGACSYYQNRGLICRLFGYSGRIDKNGQKTYLPCKPLKTVLPPLNTKALSSIPTMQAYYLKLYGIDPKLSVEYMPINEAIKKALEIVLFHFQFRKKRA